MAVGNTVFPSMNAVSGIQLGSINAGIKQTERDDVLVVKMTKNSRCAAVFTQNAFCAAPVVIAKQHLSQHPQYLLINSGNANAGTGEQGLKDSLTCCQSLAELNQCQTEQVLPFSTGVIGENLATDKIVKVLPQALANLNTDNWQAAANAIMTTDSFAKGYSKVLEIDGKTITITGISKGAGMIQPNMATMLGFIATDANIAQPLLQRCLAEAVEKSFNRITVDGDTSTNDACVLMASGQSQIPEITEGNLHYSIFSYGVSEVCQQLAELIVRDGEGATKLIKITVKQAMNETEALQVAKTVAHSPLVKTAFFASDPNWGRILAAVGRSDVENMDINAIEIYLDKVCIVKNGGRAEDYTEAAGQQVMNQEEIEVIIILGRGENSQQVTTCDFSYDYVRINAEYRS